MDPFSNVQWSRNHRVSSSYATGLASMYSDDDDARKKAQALLADTQVKAGTHVKNPDGTVTKKGDSFLDYIPVFGKKGGLGEEALADVARGSGEFADISRKWLDDFIFKNKGNDKFDSGQDVGRFVSNLAIGTIEGVLASGKNFNEMARGRRVHFDENDEVIEEREELDASQRAAAGVVGALDTVGLLAAGSGKLIKEILRKPLKEAVESKAKSTIKEGAKGFTKNSLLEGTEEAVQTVAQDIQDDSELSEDWATQAAKGFALGTAAGGIFDITGRGIGKAKDTISIKRNKNNTETEATTSTEIEIEDTATPTRSPEQIEKDARTERIGNQMVERITMLDTEYKNIVSNNDPSTKRLVASDGTDVTAVGQKFEAEIAAKETQIRDLQMQAEGANIDTLQEGVDPSEYTADVEGRAKAAETIPKLRQEIEELKIQQAEQFEMLGGVQEVIDTQAVRTKVKEIKRQKAEAQDWLIRNNMGADEATLSQMKDDIQRGAVRDEFVQIREPVNTVEEAVAMARESDVTDSSEIQRASVVNQIYKEAATQKLQTLWTPEKAAQFEVELDQNYKLREAEIRELPKPKQEEELLMLNEDYNAQRAENQARVSEDADEVQAAQQSMQILEDIDQRIVDRANSILESDPAAFGHVDAENMIEIETAVDVALTLKKSETKPNEITPLEAEGAVTGAVRNTADVEEASIIIDEDPRLSDQAATVIADQVGSGNLKGQIWDTFLVTTRDALRKLENGDKIVTELDSAIRSMAISDDTMKVRARVDRWKLTYANKEVSDQSIAYWDKGEPITKMKGESNSKFKQRQEAVDSIRTYFDSAAQARGLMSNTDADARVAELESSRTPENTADIDTQIEKINSNRMVDNYFTHIHTDMGIDVESAAEAIARLEAGVNDKGNKLTQKQREMLERKIQGIDLGTQQAIANRGIYKVGKDGNAIKRQGADGWSRDIPFVLEVYQRTTNRAVYMQPALDNIAKMTSGLKTESRQRQFVEDAIGAVLGRKTRSDQVLGDKAVKGLKTARRFSNMALMGASARTVMLQPTATLNNWRLDSEMGGGTKQYIASTLKTLKAANTPIRHSPLLREFLEAGGMEGSWATSLKSDKSSKMENVLFSGIGLMDRNMRLAAYDMGKQTYLKNKVKDPKNPTTAEYQAAKNAGIAAAREAQFGLGPLDIPLAQNSEIGKAVFQLQQFNMKQFGREFALILGDKDGSLIKIDMEAGSKRDIIKSAHLTKKGAKNLLKTIAGYSAIYALYTQMPIGDDEDSKNPFGLSFEDLIPFGEQVSALVDLIDPNKEVGEVQAPLPPVFTAVFGRGGQDKGVAGHLKDAFMGGDDIDREEELSKALQGAIRQFVPTGTQLNRTYQGAKAVAQGESINSSGSTRFLVDNNSGWNIVKGLVAGQYATTEGQEWLRTGMNTIPKDETIEYEGQEIPVSEFVRNYVQDPEKKAQYIGYYATKQNAKKELAKNDMTTTEVVEDIRLRLTAGYINQAQADLEIEKHNKILIDLYRPFMESTQNIPAYLTLDLQDNVLVDYVQPINFR